MPSREAESMRTKSEDDVAVRTPSGEVDSIASRAKNSRKTRPASVRAERGEQSTYPRGTLVWSIAAKLTRAARRTARAHRRYSHSTPELSTVSQPRGAKLSDRCIEVPRTLGWLSSLRSRPPSSVFSVPIQRTDLQNDDRVRASE